MKKLLLRILLLLFTAGISHFATAQRYITNTYGYTCYNYFDSNTIDATNNNNPSPGSYTPGFAPDPNVAANNTSVVLSAAGANNLSVTNSSGRCLTSKYQATPLAISSNFIPNTADASYKNINNNDWEWSLLYQSNLTGTNYPATPSTNVSTGLASGSNSWRYWLFSNNSAINSSTGGFYLTQNSSGKLVVYVVTGGAAYSLITSDNALQNGVPYCIKIQRLMGGSWRMYVDQYTSTVTQAKTLQASKTITSDGQGITLTYGSTFLEAENASGSDGLFKWDEIHMYTRYLKFTNVTSAANGVTQGPLYPNEGAVILWGTKVEMRGNYELGVNQSTDLTIGHTDSNYPEGNFVNALNPATIYKTTNPVFSTASPTTILTSNFQIYNGTGNGQTSGGFSDSEVASGNTDGTLSAPVYWFLGATVGSSVNSSSSISFTGVTSVKENVNNNAVTGTVVYSSGTPSTITFTTTAPPTLSTPTDVDPTVNSVAENSPTGTTVGLTVNATDTGTGYGTTNLALNKTTTTSSVLALSGNTGSKAVDGNSTGTRWESSWGVDPQWIAIDLGSVIDIRRVKLTWEGAYGKDFQIQVSNDQSTWTSIQTVTGNTSLNNDFSGFSSTLRQARYIRMYGTARGSGYGYSIYEFEVYGPSITYSLTNDAGGRFTINPSTGVVSVANGTLLDYETNTSHTITAQASNGTSTTSANFVINVTNVNEAPTITSNGGGTTAAVSIAAGASAVTTVTATDPDAGTVLTYSISGGADQAKFAINPTTGALTFITSSGLSAAGNNVYTVSVIATDNGSPALTSPAQTLTVTVTGIVGPTVATPAAQCGANIVPLTATGAAPGGGTYNWYLTSAGGTAIYTSTSNTYSPFVANTTTFYVSYTANSTTTTPRASVTVTVNPKASSSISAPMMALTFDGNGSLTDISGNANNGVLAPTATVALNTTQGPPALATDRNGVANSAYNFTGSNTNPQFIYTTTQYTPPPSVFSISVWFKTNTTSGGKIVGFGGNQTNYSNATQDRNLYMINSGQLVFGVYNGTTTPTVTTTGVFNDNLWHHAVATLGTTNGFRIYVDGVLQTTTPLAYSAPQGIQGYWRIGGDNLLNWTSRPSSDYFNGYIDDVAIYNHELSATESADNNMNLYQFSAGYCLSNPLTITAQYIPGATYSWVDNDAPTATPRTGQSVTYPSATSTSYTLTTTVGSCTNTAIVTPTTLTFTWNGSSTTGAAGFTTAANWTNSSTGISGVAPSFSGNESIIIPNGLSNYPVLNANQKFYSLTMGNNATLGLGNFTLTVGCNIFNNNNSGNAITYTAANTASGIIWAGANAVQNYVGTNTTYPMQLTNMTLNNTTSSAVVNVSGGMIDVNNLLTLTAGSLNINTTGTLTLTSNINTTASVAALGTGTAVTGNVIVQRYINGGAGHRGYKLLSSPVYDAPMGATKGYNFVDIQKNTIVTGYRSAGTYSTTPPVNDYDPSATNNPSVFFYYEPDATPTNKIVAQSDYKGINLITDYLPIGNGFLFFFRGDRTANFSTTSVATNATLNFSGTLTQGPVTVYIPTAPLITSPINGTAKVYSVTPATSTLSATFSYTNTSAIRATSAYNDGLHLIGNPYASAIDLEKITITNPYASTTSGNNYIYMMNNNGTFGAYKLTGTAGGTATINNGVGEYVLSGQGFFVRTAPVSGSGGGVSFTEAAKVPSVPTGSKPTAFAVAKPELLATTKDNISALKTSALALASTPQVLRIALLLDSLNENDTVIEFADKKSKNKFDDHEDAYYMSGLSQTTYMASYSSDGQPCIINEMGALDSIKTIPLYAEGLTNGLYTMNFSGASSLDPRYRLFLKDDLLKDSLDISANSTYSFNIDRANAKTYGAARFSISVQPTNIGDLYSLISFDGVKNPGSVNLSWKTKYEGTYTGFTVQRSIDNGVTFIDLATLQSNGTGVYTYTDANPSTATNQYRLVQNTVNNVNKLSNVVTVSYLTLNVETNKLQVFPNPVADRIQVDLKTNITTTLSIKIYSLSGNKMIDQKFSPGTALSVDVSRLIPGAYIIEVADSNNKNYGSATFTKF